MITKEERDQLWHLSHAWMQAAAIYGVDGVTHDASANLEAYLDSLTPPEGQVQVVLTEGMAKELRNHLASSPIQFGAVLRQLEPETPEQRMERAWKVMGYFLTGTGWRRCDTNNPNRTTFHNAPPDFLQSAEAREEGLRWLAKQYGPVSLIHDGGYWFVSDDDIKSATYRNPGEAIIDAILRVGEAQ